MTDKERLMKFIDNIVPNDFKCGHLSLSFADAGSLLPVVFDIDEGYRRGGLRKSDDGEYVALIGVSNMKVDESAMNYEWREDEKTTSICGLIIHSSKEAAVLSDFFKDVADIIEKQEGR